jgi:cobalamin biosynthesis protein CobT
MMASQQTLTCQRYSPINQKTPNAGLTDSGASLDPNISLWSDSVEQEADLETQPLATKFQDLGAEAFDPDLVLPSPGNPVNSFGLEPDVEDSSGFAAADQSTPWSNPGKSATRNL